MEVGHQTLWIGFITPALHTPDSTGATYATLTGRRNVRGDSHTPNTVHPAMDANDTTPCKGESADGSIEWEAAARVLLEERLELAVSSVHESGALVRRRLRNGDVPSGEELAELRFSIEELNRTMQLAEQLFLEHYDEQLPDDRDD